MVCRKPKINDRVGLCRRQRRNSAAGGLCCQWQCFLTKERAWPRTSPVEARATGVVRARPRRTDPRANPPNVSRELPKDEAKRLGDNERLPRFSRPPSRGTNRCSRAATDTLRTAVGLVFETFGPNRRNARTKDLGGRLVEKRLRPSPMAKEKKKVWTACAPYLRDKRQDDFVDNLCKKMLSLRAQPRTCSCRIAKTLAAMKSENWRRMSIASAVFGGGNRDEPRSF